MSFINVTARRGVAVIAALAALAATAAPADAARLTRRGDARAGGPAAVAPRVFMPCQPGMRNILPLVPRFRPASCETLGPRDSYSEAVNLAHLRWRNWGRQTAMFTGLEYGFHLPFSRVPVAGVVFRMRVVGGKRTYTRLRATSRFGTSTVVLGG